MGVQTDRQTNKGTLQLYIVDDSRLHCTYNYVAKVIPQMVEHPVPHARHQHFGSEVHPLAVL